MYLAYGPYSTGLAVQEGFALSSHDEERLLLLNCLKLAYERSSLSLDICLLDFDYRTLSWPPIGNTDALLNMSNTTALHQNAQEAELDLSYGRSGSEQYGAFFSNNFVGHMLTFIPASDDHSKSPLDRLGFAKFLSGEKKTRGACH